MTTGTMGQADMGWVPPRLPLSGRRGPSSQVCGQGDDPFSETRNILFAERQTRGCHPVPAAAAAVLSLSPDWQQEWP